METETNPIHLNADQKEVALRKIRELQQHVGTLSSVLNSPHFDESGLNSQLATNVLKVSEYSLADLCKLLGIVTDTTAEREQRNADLRKANMRIRELETQLGNTQGPDVTQSCIKVMYDQLNSWWDLEGFGHISSISFQRYCCVVDFSCMLTGDFRIIDSDTPVSDKERKAQWLKSLGERGFVLVEEDRDWEILDCDASRKTLIDLITTRIPSAKITKIENFSRHNAEGFTLRGIQVYIHDIADITRLPQKPKKPSSR
ncbi:hypothetical protein WL29_22725 [Burkholderia ubonensis]|uniref:Uncharacterized protein n=1 Tax=Burkholderia ubonensis TaxID=101571 RepID=A0A119HFM7_9BURK|nr:hypothetical protein [Burkholderia ubonensis]KWA84179.1 hypothetical protein WL29_22725 [Burkholderia ubonensis]